MYYDYIGAPSEGSWSPRMRKLLDTGSAVHAQLQGYLEVIADKSEGDLQFAPEADINPDVNPIAMQMDISGHTDGIILIKDGPDVVRFGLEIKTIADAGYKKTSGPHQEHMMQGTIYQKCLDLPLMVFLYYNKNDSSVAEFIHVYDERRWEAIVKKLDMVREHAIKEIPPEQEVGWNCKNCKYKAICKPPQRGRAANTKTAATFRSRKRGA